MAILGGTPAAGRRFRSVLATCGCALLAGCTFLPSEFNLSPFYRHRLDDDGKVLELDVLWPVVHYELTPDGGTDFRIRPFYRYVTEPEHDRDQTHGDGFPDAGLAATEHQFAWPLGRIRSDEEQWTGRIWPFFGYTSRLDDLGMRETDWYFVFPFVWGGSREDGNENYFGIFPIYTDFPDFFTYERFHSILFPLYLGLEKQGRTTHFLPWPFIGWADGPKGYSHRVWPFYMWLSEVDRWSLSIAWPFLHFGQTLRDTDDPIGQWLLWPLIGHQWSETVNAWTFLSPFFQYIRQGDRRLKIDILWPIYRFEEDKSEGSPLYQWWVFPFVARTITDDQWAWNFLWPLIWIRDYQDPDGHQSQRWFLPFFWNVHREREDGTEDDFTQIWPFWHHEANRDGTGDWSFPSLLPWRAGNAYGVDEAYDWLWTLVKSRKRKPDDESMHLTGHLYTSRTRGRKTQASVPLLFNYESDGDENVLRLFQFIPISWSSDDAEETR